MRDQGGITIKRFTSFYSNEEIGEDKLKFAVIVSYYKGKLVFVRHRKRDTFEIPGGKKEFKENILEAAKRELKEETGAKHFVIKEVCPYGIIGNKSEYFGKLFIADIHEFGTRCDSEIGEVIIVDDIPEKLTYPLIQPYILEKALSVKNS